MSLLVADFWLTLALTGTVRLMHVLQVVGFTPALTQHPHSAEVAFPGNITAVVFLTNVC